ncbi:MAG: histidine phosphatase family protein [Thermomicrobiales bacterium]|nr:histidine phosphatase family protein [Thermomicrobiales bacterium]
MIDSTSLPMEVERRQRFRHPHPTLATDLVLVRHGRTAANHAGKFQGSIDLPLDTLGLQQAERVAERVAREFPGERLLTSPLLRARQTADAIAARTGLEPDLVPNLREMNFGSFEGKSFREIAQIDPGFVARLADYSDDDLRWPGGERRGGFTKRIWNAFEEVVAAHPGKHVTVVAHGGVIGAFMAMLRGASPNDPAIYGLANCSITHLRVLASHTEVRRFNDTDHLLDTIDRPATEELV